MKELPNVDLEKKLYLEHLKKGNIILSPTDTIWGLHCDATNILAIEKIIYIKNRPTVKSFIIIVSDIDMVLEYVSHIPTIAYQLIQNTTEPLTIVYPEGKNLPKIILGDDNSIAIRITLHPILKQIIKEFNKPILSTSANFSGEKPPSTFEEINDLIKKTVDYISFLPEMEKKQNKPSKIIKVLPNNEFIILRE